MFHAVKHRHDAVSAAAQERTAMDILVLAIGAAFFALAFVYVRICDTL